MRRRSNAIIAEDLNDYLNQLIIQKKNSSFENDNDNLISYQLFDFENLSLNDNDKNYINNDDLLSSKQKYKIIIDDITKKFINKRKRNLIPFKIKKFQKKKRGFINNISISNSKTISCS